MNDYMRALHQRFFREPDVSELEADGLYSFDEEETERVCRRMEQEE